MCTVFYRGERWMTFSDQAMAIRTIERCGWVRATNNGVPYDRLLFEKRNGSLACAEIIEHTVPHSELAFSRLT